MLSPIPKTVYTGFASHLFLQSGKQISADAIGVVYDMFLGVTLYLQRIMKDAFNVTPRGDTCDIGAVRRLIDDYILECDPRLREQLAFVTEPQKELLYAVSEEPSPVKSITSTAFIKRHRLKSSSAVQAAAKKLLEYDLLTRSQLFHCRPAHGVMAEVRKVLRFNGY